MRREDQMFATWSSAPIRFEDVQPGDIIEGETTHTGCLYEVLRPSKVERNDGEIIDLGNHCQIGVSMWSLRKLTPPRD